MTDFITLENALRQIAADTGLDADDLITYAAEDQIGGRDTHVWSAMGIFGVEGQLMYALVRTLKPERVLEIGVFDGGTTRHLLAAFHANGQGELVSVDIEPSQVGYIPPELTAHWQFIQADALTISPIMKAELIIEDGAHTYEFTCTVLEHLKAVNPRLILSHDFYSHETYPDQFHVKEAWDKVLPDGRGLKLEGAFTGLGYWVNPDYETDQLMDQLEPPTKPKPAVKKTAAKSKRTYTKRRGTK